MFNSNKSKIYRHSTTKLLSLRYILTWPLFGIFWLIGKLHHKTNIKIGKKIGLLLYKLFPKYRYIIWVYTLSLSEVILVIVIDIA